ncbi:MAG: hypothetical protein IT422_23115 [Pirellulaceae bacterium]|nr:hypothetical protein [Pirellulaceae bacterium]
MKTILLFIVCVFSVFSGTTVLAERPTSAPLIDWPQDAEPIHPRVASIRAGVESQLKARLDRERVEKEWVAQSNRIIAATAHATCNPRINGDWFEQRRLIDYQIRQQQLYPIRVEIVPPIYPGLLRWGY